MSYYSRSYVTGDGATTDYDVSFPYLDRAHVKVYLNGVLTTDWSWVNPSKLRLTIAPANGVVILIKRQTSPEARLVDYVSPSSLNEDDLDNDSLQGFYLSQEANDQANAGIADDPVSGQYTAGGKRVTNLADPVGGQDATTKSYVDNALTLIEATVIAEATAASASSAAAAANSANVASTKRDETVSAASAASAAQVLAEAALAATLAAFDSFDDRYLGAKAIAPTVDNDGNPIAGGALFFDTVAGAMKVYTGSAWVAAYVSGSGYLASSNNLSDVANAATARGNLGIGNVDNTSDLNKPVSNAVQAILDLKATISFVQSLLTTENQTVSGGAEITEKDLGVIASGTLTLDVADRPMQAYTNNGAHTLAPGTVKGYTSLDITNGAAAGAVTLTGWTKVLGAFTTTVGHKFRCSVSVGAAGSLLSIVALQ